MAGPDSRRRHVAGCQTRGGVPVCQARRSQSWSVGVRVCRSAAAHTAGGLSGGRGAGLPPGLANGFKGRRYVAVLDSVAKRVWGVCLGVPLPPVAQPRAAGGGLCRGSTPLSSHPRPTGRPYRRSTVLPVWWLWDLGAGAPGVVLEGRGPGGLGG